MSQPTEKPDYIRGLVWLGVGIALLVVGYWLNPNSKLNILYWYLH